MSDIIDPVCVEPYIYFKKGWGYYFVDETECFNPEPTEEEKGFSTIEECREALKQHIENL